MGLRKYERTLVRQDLYAVAEAAVIEGGGSRIRTSDPLLVRQML